MTRPVEKLRDVIDLIVEVRTSECLACGGEAQGELVCVACDDDWSEAERQYERRMDQ